MYKVIYWFNNKWKEDQSYKTENEAIDRCRELARLGYFNAQYKIR